MNWKNWSYWLRGGVIGIIFLLLIMLVDFATTCDFGRKIEFCGFITLMSTFPLSYIFYFRRILGSGNITFFIHLISSFLMYFGLGALIGIIIKKLKRNKIT